MIMISFLSGCKSSVSRLFSKGNNYMYIMSDIGVNTLDSIIHFKIKNVTLNIILGNVLKNY